MRSLWLVLWVWLVSIVGSLAIIGDHREIALGIMSVTTLALIIESLVYTSEKL